MAIKKTKTEKELTEALKNNQILKQEIEYLKISLETSKTYRNELAIKYEFETKEQQEIINTLRDDLSNANIHITGLSERIYDTQNALKGYKEFSATLENDVKMMSKAIVKIMMGVE